MVEVTITLMVFVKALFKVVSPSEKKVEWNPVKYTNTQIRLILVTGCVGFFEIRDRSQQ